MGDKKMRHVGVPATKAELYGVRDILKSDIAVVRTELKSDIDAVRDELKSDIAAVRAELKSDIAAVRAELKSDIEAVRVELKSDIEKVQGVLEEHDARFTGIEENLYRLNVGFARLEGRMSDLEGKVDSLLTLKTDFADFQKILVKMSQNQETFLRRWAYHDDMLMDHERRLSKVESRLQ